MAVDIRKLDDDEILPILVNEYKQDFPEGKSAESLMKIVMLNQYDVWGIFDGEKRVGYFFGFVNNNFPFLFFDYFAIQSKLRNKGYGAKALDLLETSPCFEHVDGFVGESLDPSFLKDQEERRMAIRKLAFYDKHGFIDTGIRVVLRGKHYVIVRKVKQGKALAGPEIFFKDLKSFYKQAYGKQSKNIKLSMIK